MTMTTQEATLVLDDERRKDEAKAVLFRSRQIAQGERLERFRESLAEQNTPEYRLQETREALAKLKAAAPAVAAALSDLEVGDRVAHLLDHEVGQLEYRIRQYERVIAEREQ